MLDEAVDLLRQAGQVELADAVRDELIGRNVIEGRWTYQIAEDYDDGYYAAFRESRPRPGRLGHQRPPASTRPR